MKLKTVWEKIVYWIACIGSGAAMYLIRIVITEAIDQAEKRIEERRKS